MKLILPETIYGNNNTRVGKYQAINLSGIYWLSRKSFRKIKLSVTREKFKVPLIAFTKVVQQFFNSASEIAIEESLPINFPLKLGRFRVARCSPNPDKLYVDFKTSKKEGKRKFFVNLHTEGDFFKFKWEGYKIRHCHNFKASKTIKKKLSNSIFNGKNYLR